MTWGSCISGKPQMDIGWIHTSQLILLPRVSKISHGGGVFVASWVVQRCRLPNIHYGLLRQNSSGLEFKEPSQLKRSVKLVCFTTVEKPMTLRHPDPARLRRSAEGTARNDENHHMFGHFHLGQWGVPSLVTISIDLDGSDQRKSNVLAGWCANSPKLSPGECMWTIWTLATGSSGLSPHGLYSFGIGHLESPGSADFPSQSVDSCWVVLRSSTVTQFIIMFPLKLWDVLGGIATPAKDFKVRSYLHFSGTTFLFWGERLLSLLIRIFSWPQEVF